jgi:hypothetical protein
MCPQARRDAAIPMSKKIQSTISRASPQVRHKAMSHLAKTSLPKSNNAACDRSAGDHSLNT